MHISRRDVAFASLAVAYSWPATNLVVVWVTESQAGAAIAVVLAIIMAYLTLVLIDWLLWKPHGKEHRGTWRALRQAELTMGIALGDLSSKRFPRRWWRRFYLWRLRRTYRD